MKPRATLSLAVDHEPDVLLYKSTASEDVPPAVSIMRRQLAAPKKQAKTSKKTQTQVTNTQQHFNTQRKTRFTCVTPSEDSHVSN
jgi:hypothetical protein